MAEKSPPRLARWVGAWLRRTRIAAKIPRDRIATDIERDYSAVSRIERAASITADDLPAVLRAYGLTPHQYADEAVRVMRRAARTGR